MTGRYTLEDSSKRHGPASCVAPRPARRPRGEPKGVLAVLCPGQGSQTPGFLRPWLELPGTADRLAALSQAAGIDLVVHGTESDAETIRDTAITQPLIVAGSLVAFEALTGAPLPAGSAVGVTAGHSVGELAAAAIAGVLTAEQAVALVAERGRAMARASAAAPTGMSAVLGGDADEVAAVLARHGLTAANMNAAGQVVAAGTVAQLQALAADPPTRARVIPLQVAGAFHTTHMAPAVNALSAAAAGIAPGQPVVRLLSNADGSVVEDGAEALRRLVVQVSNPVRWDLCLATLQELGVTGLLELPPAGTLTNLAKRALTGVATVAVKTPDDLDAARTLVAEHASGDSLQADPTGGTR